MNIEFYDVDGDLVNITTDGGFLSLDLSVGANVLALDTEKAKYMIGILSHYAETGELREPINEESPAEEAATNSLGDEIKALSDAHGELVEACARTDAFLCKLTERVAALEQVKKPQPYGLWSLQWGNWHSGSPWESAGEATDYATQSFYPDWRNYWRVYPYPEDGGMPVELRPSTTEKWGLWGSWDSSNPPHWFSPHPPVIDMFTSREEAESEVGDDCWKAYPYPADGGMPMELREEKKAPTSEQLWEYLVLNGWRPRLGGYWVHPNGRVSFGQVGKANLGDYIAEIAKVEGKDVGQVLAGMLSVSFETPNGQFCADRPTVYYVRNKSTGNFLRRVDQKDRNTLFVTEDQVLAEHMAQGTEGGPYEVYPVTLGE